MTREDVAEQLERNLERSRATLPAWVPTGPLQDTYSYSYLRQAVRVAIAALRENDE